MALRQCETCKRFFEATPRASYCSSACKAKFAAWMRRGRATRPRVCSWCFQTFWTNIHNKRHCSSSCKAKFHYQEVRWGSTNSAPITFARCAHCGRSKTMSLVRTSPYCGPCFRAGHQMKRQNQQRANGSVEYDRIDIFERDQWTCQICGEHVDGNVRFPDPMAATIDHIEPVSQGGADAPSNVQLAHSKCNSRKGARVPAAAAQ